MWQMALEIKRDIFPVSNISFSHDCAENLYWVLQSQRICVGEIRVLLQPSSVWGAVQRLAMGCTVGVRKPVGAWNFSLLHMRPNRPWGPLGLLYNGYQSSSTGVKRPGRVVHHQTPSSTEVKNEKSIRLTPLCVSYCMLRGYLYLHLSLLSYAFLKLQKGSSYIRTLNQQVN